MPFREKHPENLLRKCRFGQLRDKSEASLPPPPPPHPIPPHPGLYDPLLASRLGSGEKEVDTVRTTWYFSCPPHPPAT